MKKAGALILVVGVFLSMFSPWLASTAQAAPGNYLVVLDPGDGGVVGATGPTGLQEKVVNLDIALRVRDKLVGAGYRVMMTRDGDNPVSLPERVAIANRNNANVFVSIHTNSVARPEVHGTETYFSSQGAPYGNLLAHHIQSRVVINTGSQNRGVKDRAFFVITHTTMPAALQEGEFISNPDKEALLRTDGFRDQIAQGIFEGIVNFLNQYGNVATASSPELNPAHYTYRAAYNDFQRTPSSLSPGQQVSFPFAVRNLSNFTWSSSPPNQVNLSYHIYDSRGRMVTSLNGLRSPLPRNVAPGEVVNLTITIQAPTSPGTYTIAYDMVLEGVSWFSQRKAGVERRTFSVGGTAAASPLPIVLAAAVTPTSTQASPTAQPSPAHYTYRAAYNDFQRTPSSLSPGQQVSFPFAVRNLSNFTWSSSPPNQVNLSYHIYDSRGRMVTSLNGLRSPLPRNVAPGEVVNLTITIQAPTSPGTYTIAYDMVLEGVSWFSQRKAGVERRTFSVGGAASASPTPASSGAVTNETSVRGVSQVTEQQLVDLFRKRGFTAQVPRAQELAPLYIKWGREFNIRADIAWAQMAHETGFLTFGGIVPPDANNFAGIGATGAKNPDGTYKFNRFATPELGVIAHYARLAWYVYPDHVNEFCSPQYDPRRLLLGNRHGNFGENLGVLNGRWAPSPIYTDKIIQFANMIGR